MKDELPPRLLQALVLRDQFFSYNEIAKKMGVSKSTVATYLWAARKLGLVIECDRRWAKKVRREQDIRGIGYKVRRREHHRSSERSP